MNDVPEVMNIRQACAYLGVSSDSLYKYAVEKKVPAFKIGNRWRFTKSALDRWMDENSHPRDSKEKRRRRPLRE